MSVKVFPRHVRAAKICMPGSRKWVRAQGLDWAVFVSEGFDSDMLLAINDPITNRAVAEALKEAEHG
ncbi:MAG: hypothetical protein K2Q20_05600 [Phycisphaerales bacterium]|nr:hypothetical protein [Phycisphaerales bacterium]